MTTGEKIKTVRQRAGYTQEQLAEKLLVSRQAITKWEADRGIPDVENLKAIAKHFDLSVDDLLNPAVEISGAVTAERETISTELTEPLAETLTQREPAPEMYGEKSARKKRVVVPIMAGAAALVLLFVLLTTVILPNIKQNNLFKEAETLMAQGDYAAAAAIFDGIGTPKAEEKLLACRYAYANKLYTQGQYPAALSELHDILTYEDAADLYDRWSYEYALHCVKQENYAQAISLLEELGDYKDAKAKLDELYACYGCILFEEEQFEEAIAHFNKTSLGEYFYVAKAQAQYNYAVQLYNSGQYGLAYNAFNQVVKYYPDVYLVDNLENAPSLAKDTLQKLLLAGALWTKTTTYNTGNTKSSIALSITSSLTQIALNDTVSGQHIGTLEYNTNFFIPTDTLRDAGVNEVYVGGVTDSGEVIVFTFSFSSNSRVTVHYNDVLGGCDDVVCGTYEINEQLADSSGTLFDLIFKNQQLSYISLTSPMFTLSFLNELPSDDTR